MPLKHIWPPNKGLLQKQQCPIYWSYFNPRSQGSHCTHQDSTGSRFSYQWPPSALCHTAFPNIRAEQTPFFISRYITSRCSHNKVNVHHQIHVPAPLLGMEGTGSVKREGIVLFQTLQGPRWGVGTLPSCGRPALLQLWEILLLCKIPCITNQWFQRRNDGIFQFLDLFETKWSTDL